MTEVVCRDGCKRVAVDEETAAQAGWQFLSLQKRYRCPTCLRELRDANLEFSKEYYMNEEKKLEAEMLRNMQRVDAKPGDTVVLFFQQIIMVKSKEALTAYWESRMPGVKVLVLDGGGQLGVLVGQENTSGSGI